MLRPASTHFSLDLESWLLVLETLWVIILLKRRIVRHYFGHDATNDSRIVQWGCLHKRCVLYTLAHCWNRKWPSSERDLRTDLITIY